MMKKIKIDPSNPNALIPVKAGDLHILQESFDYLKNLAADFETLSELGEDFRGAPNGELLDIDCGNIASRCVFAITDMMGKLIDDFDLTGKPSKIEVENFAAGVVLAAKYNEIVFSVMRAVAVAERMEGEESAEDEKDKGEKRSPRKPSGKKRRTPRPS
jgi:hypothetical protein